MSRTLTAMIATGGLTYCTHDGTPYRPDWSGLFHAETRHVTELTAMTAPAGGVQPAQATATQIAGTFHKGCGTSVTVES